MERTFGVFKERFRIFRRAPEYPIDTQVQIVYACVVVHNFLSKAGALEVGREHLGLEAAPNLDDIGNVVALRPSRDVYGSKEMNKTRDQIMETM